MVMKDGEQRIRRPDRCKTKYGGKMMKRKDRGRRMKDTGGGMKEDELRMKKQ